MDLKKKKKSKQDLIDSTLTGLGSQDPTNLFGPILPINDETNSKVDRAFVNPGGARTEGSDWNETRVLPEGIESATAIYQNPTESEPLELSDSEESNEPAALDIPEDAPSFDAVSPPPFPADEKTAIIGGAPVTPVFQQTGNSDGSDPNEKTVVVGIGGRGAGPMEAKVSFGVARPSTRTLSSATASESDARISQAENLRVAQERLLDLEKELERLREENEQLSSANTAAKDQVFELTQKVEQLEQQLSQSSQLHQSEVQIYRDSASLKEVEIVKSRAKISELETRLHQDLRKVRVRERELENRLEMTRMEKEALMRAKDDAILDLKRKLEQLNHEIDGYRQRVGDLNARIESNNDQFTRTVRALRLALTNLEVNDSGGNGNTVPPFKKAE